MLQTVLEVGELALCGLGPEDHHGVVHEQGVDACHVGQQRLVGRHATQRDLCLRHDVREAPGEFLERRAVARRGQGVGGTACHLGDAAEVADAVVARGNVRVAQVKQVELIGAPGALRLGIQPQHEVSIALGIDDDGHVSRMDVLGGQHLQHARLAHPRGAQHDHVTRAGGLAHGDGPLSQRADTVKDGRTSQIGMGLEGVQPAVVIRDHASDLFHCLELCGQFRDRYRPLPKLHAHLAQGQFAWLRPDKPLRIRSRGIALALCVLLGPLEALTQVILARAHGNLVRGHLGDLVIFHPVLVAQDLDSLFAADPSEVASENGNGPAQNGRHHQGPGRSDGHQRHTPCHGRAPQLDWRAQERFECVVVLHCTPNADGLLGELVMKPSGITTSG